MEYNLIKKGTCLALILTCGSVFLIADKIFKLNEIYKNPIVSCVDNQSIYVFDPMLCKVNVYSTSSGSLKLTFGKKGQGPGEFMGIGFILGFPNEILVSAAGKIATFDKNGKFLKQINIPWGISSVYPIKNNYLCKEYHSGPENTVIYVNLADSKIKKIKSLVVWEKSYELPKNEKQNIFIYQDFFGYTIDLNKIYIGNSTTGSIVIFDWSGEKIKEIKLSLPRIPFSVNDKKNTIDGLIEKLGVQRFNGSKAKFNLIFPKYFPFFDNFTVDKGIIYILAREGVNGQKVITLDHTGKIVREKKVLARSTRPDGIDMCVVDGIYYYIIENMDEECWEIHIESI